MPADRRGADGFPFAFEEATPMIPAQTDPTAHRDPRDYRANRAQVNQAEGNVLHSHVGAKIL